MVLSEWLAGYSPATVNVYWGSYSSKYQYDLIIIMVSVSHFITTIIIIDYNITINIYSIIIMIIIYKMLIIINI